MRRDIRINVSVDSALDSVLDRYAMAVELSKSEAIYGVLKEAEPNLEKVAGFVEAMKKALRSGDDVGVAEAVLGLEGLLGDLVRGAGRISE